MSSRPVAHQGLSASELTRVPCLSHASNGAGSLASSTASRSRTNRSPMLSRWPRRTSQGRRKRLAGCGMASKEKESFQVAIEGVPAYHPIAYRPGTRRHEVPDRVRARPTPPGRHAPCESPLASTTIRAQLRNIIRSAEAISAISPSRRTVTPRASIDTEPTEAGPGAASTSSAAKAVGPGSQGSARGAHGQGPLRLRGRLGLRGTAMRAALG